MHEIKTENLEASLPLRCEGGSVPPCNMTSCWREKEDEGW